MKSRTNTFSAVRRALLSGLAVAALTPAISAVAQEKTVVTLWSWNSSIEQVIAAYEAENPDVDIELVHPGGAAEQYLKFRNTMRAGSGIPDIVHSSFAIFPSFIILDYVEDLAPFGLGEYQDQFPAWTWSQVTQGEKIFTLPWDIGPIALLYRQDIFEEYGLEIPTTWAEFEEQARKLHEQNPEVKMANMNLNQDWIQAMFWQAGTTLFEINGTEIDVNINNPRAKEVADYWQRLIDDGLVEAVPGYNTEWWAGMDAGRYATWPGPKWATTTMTRNSNASLGEWRVSDIPQWTDDSSFMSANWGGSVLFVPKGAGQTEAAADVIEWMMAGPGAEMFADAGLWPTLTSVTEAPDFAEMKHELYGDQNVNEVFLKSAAAVDVSWQYSPFQDLVDARFSEEFAAAAAGNGTFSEALDRLQQSVTEYAQDQGFTVINE
jgi:multiple sugar transport system substrate-binding protein